MTGTESVTKSRANALVAAVRPPNCVPDHLPGDPIKAGRHWAEPRIGRANVESSARERLWVANHTEGANKEDGTRNEDFPIDT